MNYQIHIIEALLEFSKGKTHERNINFLLPHGLITKLPHVRRIEYYTDNTSSDCELTELGKQVLAGLDE